MKNRIQKVTALVCLLSAANTWGAVFLDDFNRANGDVGNGWTIQTNGTITVQVVDNEILIAGTEGTSAWARAGITRPVSGETRVSFDFKADDVFNVHLGVHAAASPAWLEIYAWAGGNFSYANSTDGSWPAGPWTAIAGSNMVAGEYNTVVLEQEGTEFTVTLNGKVVGTITNASFTRIESVQIASDANTNQTGSLHIDNVQIGVVVPGVAKDPSPVHNATDIPRDVALAWTAGAYANTHNVYLGTSFDDVNTANVTKAVSKGQTGTTFEPAGLLEYGKTYYWRVDEVNAPPTNTVFKGDVWNFTVEPYTYMLSGVTVAASSESQDMPAAKTVDGSGLNASGQHSSVDVDGWLTAPDSQLPAWIQYNFDRAYTIQQMHVWNSNQQIEMIVGFGAKTVLIESSLDGATWTTLNTVEFPQAEGVDTYAGFVVDMGGVQAKSVRLTIQSNWSPFLQQVGLSEVRFAYVPLQARQPSPAMNAAGVPVDAGFAWREGRKTASQKVYFSMDEAAVASGKAPVNTTTKSSYQPPALNFGSFYYWRVDEVNGATEWPGDVWAFTTAEYGDIDNFESYTDESPNRVFQAWIDGWGFSPDDSFPNGNQGNGSGALVGYDPSIGDIMETAIIHGGTQSMPVEYNNVNQPYYSEIDRTWTTAQNWTTNGATELSLWVHGSPAALVETATGVTLSGAGADIYMGTAEFRFAYKKLSGDGSITVRLDSAQTAANWTKCGVMVRESLEPLAIQVHMISAPQQTLVEWMYRSTAKSATTTQFNTAAGTNPLPVWLRLTRAGNVFTGECSADGKTWTKIAATDATPSSTTITMPTSVYIGMVVCSQSAGNLAVANFSQIKTTGNITGNWQAADIGVAQPANKPDQLYVVLQDSANKTVTVKHPDGVNAVVANQWTQWKIPLSQLTGVNTKAIKKMIIGVGDRSNPKAGPTGHIFIDDIQYGRSIGQ